MRPKERDLAYLWDMREAAREIRDFVRGISFAKFEKNHMIRYAVERQLLVIGEAASHVSDGFRQKHPEIPWAQIIGQRNILAHEYGEILAERIWLTATKSVPDCSGAWTSCSIKNQGKPTPEPHGDAFRSRKNVPRVLNLPDILPKFRWSFLPQSPRA